MSRIEELHKSFVTMIVRYHGTKLAKEASSRKEGAQDLLQKPEAEIIATLTALPAADMIAALTVLINAVTKEPETTSLLSLHIPRRPVLMYILHGVAILKSIVVSQEKISEDCVARAKEQLAQLIIDVQTLLSMSQSTELECTYDTNVVRINGFIRPLWSGYSLCNSGAILQSTLFTALDLPLSADPIRIKKTVSSILTEHQAHLLDHVVKMKDEKILHLEKALQYTQSELALERYKEDAHKPLQKKPPTINFQPKIPMATRAASDISGVRMRAKEEHTIKQQPLATPMPKLTAQPTRMPHHSRSNSTTHFWPRSLSSGLFSIAKKLGEAFGDADAQDAPIDRIDSDSAKGDDLNFGHTKHS